MCRIIPIISVVPCLLIMSGLAVPGWRSPASPRVPSVHVTPAVPSEQHLVSYTWLVAPKEATEAYKAAFRCWRKGKGNLKATAGHLERAIAVYPDFADAWQFLGAVRYSQHELEAAREAFLQALTADSRYVHSLIPLALLDLERGRFNEAAAYAERARKLDPDLTEADYYYAVACHLMGRIELAGQVAVKIIEEGKGRQFPRAHAFAGAGYAAKGDYQSAAAAYETYLRLEPGSALAERVRGQLAQWREAKYLQSSADAKRR